MDLGGKSTGACNGANVRGNNYELIVVVLAFGELIEVVLNECWVAQQMIHRNVEEALDLRCMQVHSQDAVSTGSGDHVGNQLSGDRIAALGFTILTGIAKVGDHGGNAAGRSTAAGIDHNKQLHQVIVDRLAGGLNQEHICATNCFKQGNSYFAVSKSFDFAVAQGQTQFLTNCLCKGRVGVTAENLDIFSVCNHLSYTSL